MKLLYFDVIITVLYFAGMVFLIYEYKISSVEIRKELVTGPLIFSFTFTYLVAILKTHQLALLFSMYL